MLSKYTYILPAKIILFNCIIWRNFFFYRLALLPNIFYIKGENKKFFFSLALFKKFFPFFFSSSFFILIFFKLRLRGLGYKIKKVSSNIWRLLFNRIHYIYLFLPSSILLFYKKKKLLLLSFDKVLLNSFINKLIITTISSRYVLQGFIKTRKIFFLRETTKKF